MALSATIYRFAITVSDVERSVYETLDLRVARHPSESVRYFLTRTLAYCLQYEEGIAFSKGGLSESDEPPLAVHDPTGILLAWIDVGSPSAARLHRASKAARRVALFSHTDLGLLQREAASQRIHELEKIEVYLLQPSFLDALEPHLDRNLKLELVRSDGTLYVTLPKALVEGTITEARLAS